MRQEDRATGTKGSYGVSHSLVSRGRPEGGGWGLDVSGEVQCVALQFGKGDWRMLQVVEQHLDLREDKEKERFDFTIILTTLPWLPMSPV